MVTFTNISDNNTDTFIISDYFDCLTPNPKPTAKDKQYLCPCCNGNDFSINHKDQKTFQCFNNNCQTKDIVIELKKRKGTYKENLVKPSASDRPLLKIRAARKDGVKHFWHDIAGNENIKLCYQTGYENGEKSPKLTRQFLEINGKKIYKNISEFLTSVGSSSNNILPYFAKNFSTLIDLKPTVIGICEGQMTAAKCYEKFKLNLPVISGYGGSNINNIPNLVSQIKEYLPSVSEVVLMPDMDVKGVEYMAKMSELLTLSDYTVKFLLAYPDSNVWDNLSNLGSGVDMFDYLNDERYKHLTAQEIIDRITVLSQDDLDRMTGKAIYPKSISIPIKDFIKQSGNTSIDWLIPGIIQKNVSNMIVSYAGVGKSTLCSQLAIALTQGGNFLDHDLPGNQKVLYHTSDESPLIDLKYRLIDQGLDFDNENLSILYNVNSGEIWNINYLQELDHELSNNDHDVVIIDSISSVIINVLGCNENGPEVMRYITQLVELICHKHNKTLILVHHGNKKIKDDGKSNIFHVSGHNGIIRSMNQVVSLTANPIYPEQVELLVTKTRNSTPVNLKLEIDDERKFKILEVLSASTVATEKDNIKGNELILNYLEKVNDWATRQEIQQETQLSKSRCNSILFDLVASEIIERRRLPIGISYQYRLNSQMSDRPGTSDQAVTQTVTQAGLNQDISTLSEKPTTGLPENNLITENNFLTDLSENRPVNRPVNENSDSQDISTLSEKPTTGLPGNINRPADNLQAVTQTVTQAGQCEYKGHIYKIGDLFISDGKVIELVQITIENQFTVCYFTDLETGQQIRSLRCGFDYLTLVNQ